MKANEIIRNILDLIDQIDGSAAGSIETVNIEPVQIGDEVSRFKQIFDLLSSEQIPHYDNSPDEVVSGVEAVTINAGGGVNGPKNPADIKSNSISMYPAWQAERK